MMSNPFPTFRLQLWILLLLGTCVFSGCQTTAWQGFPRTSQAELVWPGPPEAARLAYVMQIRRHQDLFEEAGTFQFFRRLFTGATDSTMVRPFAMALHPAGGLLVADPGANCVHFYNWGRRRYIAIGMDRPEGLPSPVGVTALADGRILISDSRLKQLFAYDADGKPLGTFGPTDQFTRPAGLVADPRTGEIFVADVMSHRIAVLSSAGQLLRWIGKRGAEPGAFNFPTHLALTPEGNLAVSDSMNFRVQIVTPQGAPVSHFGEPGDSAGLFAQLKGIASDSAGHLVTVEGLYDRMLFFDQAGTLLLQVGGAGSAPGQFWLPAGLCVDPAEQLLFVADSYNKRVQVFRLLGGTAP